ncbi:hypothetical protein ACHHYP_14222 [Achlya hypogyna]|uniref:PDZ domain-containing protein n=1 Tax=Achlya hypogyna TaxID=1202772 RepID=A0A1V9YDQ3_ACHHY|nr:hypothetical protein ACHHYP_14222 [Achlya hypogyna]
MLCVPYGTTPIVPDDPRGNMFGIVFDYDDPYYPVAVKDIIPGSAAHFAGLRKHDRITGVSYTWGEHGSHAKGVLEEDKDVLGRLSKATRDIILVNVHTRYPKDDDARAAFIWHMENRRKVLRNAQQSRPQSRDMPSNMLHEEFAKALDAWTVLAHASWDASNPIEAMGTRHAVLQAKQRQVEDW